MLHTLPSRFTQSALFHWILAISLLVVLPVGVTIGCATDTEGVDDPKDNGGQGVCVFADETECNGACVRLNTDPNHCGSCETKCGTGQSCSGGSCTSCAVGQLECGANGACLDVMSNTQHCGQCNNPCNAGQSCVEGTCTSGEGFVVCGGVEVDTRSNINHCGGCDTACDAGQVCSQSACSSSCQGTETNCAGACVDTMSNQLNCGGCDKPCNAGQACGNGICGCPGGQFECGGQCTNTLTNSSHCGACDSPCPAGAMCAGGQCQCPMGSVVCAFNNTCQPAAAPCEAAGAGGAGNDGAGNAPNQGAGDASNAGGAAEMMEPEGAVVTVEGRTCPATEGLIADFEEDSFAVLELEGRVGLFDQFNDGGGTQETVIETDGTEDCNKGVLHTTGSGFSEYVGVGTVLTGTWDDAKQEYAPAQYDASAYTGIAFRAKRGANQQYPVRVSVSKPRSVGDESGDGQCDDSDDNNICWNHLGHFLIDDEELTTEWKTFHLCFDRDFYPMFLPSNMDLEQRRNVGSDLLGMQFQFNQSFDPSDAMQVPLSGTFDFYADDIRFFTGECPTAGDIFESTGGASDAFGTNAAVGSCAPVPNAEAYNKAISQAYARWRDAFVVSDSGLKVISPEQNNVTTSEGMGYGMLIAAAMGDKETFDGLLQWVNGKTGNLGGLLGWQDGGGGSATDADTDIAYALLMAGAQWGSDYTGLGNSYAGKAYGGDVNGSGQLKPGDSWEDAFNPSYFSPGFYRAMGGSWSGAIAPNYSLMSSCDAGFTGADGILPDWCNYDGSPRAAGGAQVVSEVCDNSEACSAYDAARVPWRIGYDVCMGGSEGSSLLNSMISTFNSKFPRIDTLQAGFNSSGESTMSSVKNEMAFIGTVGVAALAADNAEMRDRAFQAVLDIIERPEFYNTYYSTSLGLQALLVMSGNWPVP